MGGQQPISASGADSSEQPNTQQAAAEGTPAPVQVCAAACVVDSRKHSSQRCTLWHDHCMVKSMFQCDTADNL